MTPLVKKMHGWLKTTSVGNRQLFNLQKCLDNSTKMNEKEKQFNAIGLMKA